MPMPQRSTSPWPTRPCGSDPPPARDSYLNIDGPSSMPCTARAPRRSIPAMASCRERRVSRRRWPMPAPCLSARRSPPSAPWARRARPRPSWAVPACRWCPAITATTRRTPTCGAPPDRTGYPALIKAVAGGGRQGHAPRRPRRGLRRGPGRRPPRGQGRLRRRPRADREIRAASRATSRCRCLRTPRETPCISSSATLDPAPPPEGRGGGAGAGLSAELRAALGRRGSRPRRRSAMSAPATIEFLLDPGGAFYFMEMNTRLQVEHPVTELITDLDLVEWQLRVAAGQPLPRSQDKILFCGHAIETRLYAEDPARGFLPATGRPRPSALAGGRASTSRVDTGIRAGDEISVHYDPMIAKLAVWGEDRFRGGAQAARGPSACRFAGPPPQRRLPAAHRLPSGFEAADLDTAFIERHRATSAGGWRPAPARRLGHACAELTLYQEQIAREAALKTGDPWSPWCRADGWRLNGEGHGRSACAARHRCTRISQADRAARSLRTARETILAPDRQLWRSWGHSGRKSRRRRGCRYRRDVRPGLRPAQMGEPAGSREESRARILGIEPGPRWHGRRTGSCPANAAAAGRRRPAAAIPPGRDR